MKWRIISLRQPYAWLYATGNKMFETRSWSTSFRGDILIHASGRIPTKKEIAAFLADPHFGYHFGRPDDILSLSYGKIIGTAKIVDVRRSEFYCMPEYMRIMAEHYGKSHIAYGDVVRERTFGDYSPGRHFFITTGAKLLDVPVKTPGRLGIYKALSKRHFSCDRNDKGQVELRYFGEHLATVPTAGQAIELMDALINDPGSKPLTEKTVAHIENKLFTTK